MIFDKCYKIQQDKFKAIANADKKEIKNIEQRAKDELSSIQNELDELVYKLYDL